ncbi:HIRA-interacting protein 3 [Embiotoca jacksoni]|uniref:HIRA-interacting protein 3 n=1 Tax=Embiotoca jacksoni TaxID=100190 RepID=UPI0037043E08
MMVSKKESAAIRRFVCGELRDGPDLSTLTLGILKRRYLAHAKCDSLSPDARSFMKQVVEEELIKMQDSDRSGSESETKKLQNKRKRANESDKGTSESEDESRAKNPRSNHPSSSSETEDKEVFQTASERSKGEEQVKSRSGDEEQEVKKSQRKTNKQQVSSDDSSDDEMNETRKPGNESSCDESPDEVVKKEKNLTKNGKTRSSDTNEGKKTPHSDEEDESDADSKSEKSDKISGNESSDDSDKEEKVSVEKKDNDADSDSSSLTSLEDEQNRGTKNTQDAKKKKKTVKKDDRPKGQKDEDKAVVRLKRYIALCGVRKNYKKLLDGCRSIRSKVAVLKKELEDLGVHGQPSIEKCRKARMKREEAQEVAELDVNNIIVTQGRPKRRGASTWQEKHDPPSSEYQHTLNSGSDSDEENNAPRGRRRVTQWTNLQGIISDDADSD